MKIYLLLLFALPALGQAQNVKFTTDKIFASSGTVMNTNFCFEIRWGKDENSVDTINGQCMVQLLHGIGQTHTINRQ